jgi:biopolymer transport protein ExbB
MNTPAKSAARRFLLALVGAWVFAISIPAIHAQDATPPPPTTEIAEKSLLDLYNQGGFLMHFILLCSIGTIAVGVFCGLQINRRKMQPRDQVDTLTHYLQAQNAGEAYLFCEENPSAFTNTVGAALLKVNFERELANKFSMEQAAGETLAGEEIRLMVWVNYLNVFATLAPMLGLLGTVTGMIQSFDQLAAGRSEPSDLAGGIGQAMLTTAGGLVVGIPAMFLYFFFRNKLVIAVTEIQKSTTFLIDILSGELKLAEATQAPPAGTADPTSADQTPA